MLIRLPSEKEYEPQVEKEARWLAIISLSAILIGIIATTSVVVTLTTLTIYMFITLMYISRGRFNIAE